MRSRSHTTAISNIHANTYTPPYKRTLNEATAIFGEFPKINYIFLSVLLHQTGEHRWPTGVHSNVPTRFADVTIAWKPPRMSSTHICLHPNDITRHANTQIWLYIFVCVCMCFRFRWGSYSLVFIWFANASCTSNCTVATLNLVQSD